MSTELTPTQKAILEFAEECGTVFDSADGFATVTVDAAMLHEYVRGVWKHSREQAIGEVAAAMYGVVELDIAPREAAVAAIRSLATKDAEVSNG